MPLPHAPQAMITGAAGGFGRALAVELASRRARLVLADLDAEGCAETARLALAAGAEDARSLRCDVRRLEDVEALAAACEGAPDLVVNNAGVSSAGAVGELSIEDWRWTLDVDLWGVIHGCHVFAPRMKARGSGHLLNVASAAGLLCAPNMAAYNVAKAGVVALSETLHTELRGTGVGVTVVCPTFFQTGIAARGRFTTPELRRTAERLVGRGRHPEDVARAAIAVVDRDELYSVPMADGRWLWRMKRLAPAPFGALLAKVGKRLER